MRRRADEDVILPPYRRATYHPENPVETLREVEVTPAVVAAAHPEMVSKFRIFESGVFHSSLRVSEVAKVCNMSARKAQRILNGQIAIKRNDLVVIAAYLQMTLEELEAEIVARRRISQEWIQRRRRSMARNREG